MRIHAHARRARPSLLRRASGFVQPCAAANPARASRLQSLPPLRRVAALGSLGFTLMSKRYLIFCLAAVALIAGAVWVIQPSNKVITHATKKDTHHFSYRVIVRQRGPGGYSGARYRAELLAESGYRDVPISSYEFYESIGATNAVITWPALTNFTISLDHGTVVQCLWNDYEVHWTKH